jgi:hypothetical protein
MHMDKYCMVVVQMQRKPKAGANRTIKVYIYVDSDKALCVSTGVGSSINNKA